MGHLGVQKPWHVQKHFVGTWEVSRPPRCRARPQRKKERFETNDEKPREIKFGHSSCKAGEQRAATLCGACGAKGRGQRCVRPPDASAAGESPAERKGSHHFHREPCAGHREVSGEASAAACAGRAIETGNTFNGCAEMFLCIEGNTSQPLLVRRRKASRGPRTMVRAEALHRDLRGL